MSYGAWLPSPQACPGQDKRESGVKSARNCLYRVKVSVVDRCLNANPEDEQYTHDANRFRPRPAVFCVNKRSNLTVCYERKAEVRNRVGTGIISIGVFYQRGALHLVRPTGLAGINF